MFSSSTDFSRLRKLLRVLPVFSLFICHTAFAQYCVPVVAFPDCNGLTKIAGVELNTLNNPSGLGCFGPDSSYSDFTGEALLTTSLTPGATYTCKVNVGAYYLGVAAWIDYNDDGVFNDSTERVGQSDGYIFGSDDSTVVSDADSFDVSIALCAPPGQHRLRIRGTDAPGLYVTPCDTSNDGETEDYLITVSVGCPPGGALSAANPTLTTADISWLLGCSNATEWDFEYGLSGFTQGSGTLLSGVAATDNYQLTGLTSTTDYDIYYRANCGGTTSDWSAATSFSTLPEPCSTAAVAGTATATADTLCRGELFTLDVSGYATGTGITHRWIYSEDSGATWDFVAGIAGSSMTTFINGSTQFRFVAGCPFSAQYDSSNVVTVEPTLFYDCYCTASGGGGTASLMHKITIRDYVAAVSQPAVYYTLHDADTLSLALNGLAIATFDIDSFSVYDIPDISAWIDFDHDGRFSAAEWQPLGFADVIENRLTGGFLIDEDAVPGVTRMRIRSVAWGESNGPQNACNVTATGETEDFFVNLVPAVTTRPQRPALITPSVSGKACPGDVRTYSVPFTFDTEYYVWVTPTGANILEGQFGNSVVVEYDEDFYGGYITVIGVNELTGTSAPRRLLVGRRLNPHAPTAITGSGVAGCGLTAVPYSVPVSDTSLDYNWSFDTGEASVASGQGTAAITADFTTDYTLGVLSVTVTDGCGTSSPRRFRVRKGPAPAAPAVITGQASGLCGQTGIPYSVAPEAGVSYNWSFDVAEATVATGQGTDAITADFDPAFGMGYLFVTGTDGCGTGSPKRMRIRAVPGSPGTIDGPETVCGGSVHSYTIDAVTGAADYTWTAPPGASVTDGVNTAERILTTTSPTVDITFGNWPGRLTVRANSPCGSSASSIIVDTSCSGSKPGPELITPVEHTLMVQLFPNPAGEIVTVRINADAGGKAFVRILTVTGQELLNGEITSVKDGNLTLPIHSLASGIYMVEVTVNGQKIVKPLTKQ